MPLAEIASADPRKLVTFVNSTRFIEGFLQQNLMGSSGHRHPCTESPLEVGTPNERAGSGRDEGLERARQSSQQLWR